MDDAFAVCCIEPIRDVDGNGKQHLLFQRTTSNAVLQGQAVEELHNDEGAAICFADVMNGTDVGMVQSRSGLCLALKAGERKGIVDHGIRQELKRYKTVQPGVFRLVDHTHPATANFFHNAVMRDGSADHVGGRRHG